VVVFDVQSLGECCFVFTKNATFNYVNVMDR